MQGQDDVTNYQDYQTRFLDEKSTAQAVAAMTGTAAPRLRAAPATGMPAAAPARVPAAPASAPASAVPEPEPMPADPVPVQLAEVGSLTLPVNGVKRTEVQPEDGKLAAALFNGPGLRAAQVLAKTDRQHVMLFAY